MQPIHHVAKNVSMVRLACVLNGDFSEDLSENMVLLLTGTSEARKSRPHCMARQEIDMARSDS